MALTEETPVPPTAGYKGDITPTHSLRYPKYDEVAEVPQDMANLAYSVERALDKKLDLTLAATTYQADIKVVVGTSVSALPASAPEGTVYFLIAP